MNNISTVNGAAVPSISSSLRSFNKHGISAAIIGSDSNSFIEESVEVFNSDGFVIALSSDMDVNELSSANGLEESKSAAVINNNQTAKSELQKDFLDKQTSEIMSCNVVSGIDNDKACDTHDVHKISFTTVILDCARLPKIDTKDIKWAAERP